MKSSYALSCLFVMAVWAKTLPVLAQASSENHPRILIHYDQKDSFLKSLEGTKWKAKYVESLQSKLKPYMAYWKADTTWLVSRLQMNWNTRHNQVFVKGGKFSHSAGDAPVPTVRFSGSRDWASDYRAPRLEDIIPYQDDKRGVRLINKKTGEPEWIHPSASGNIIEGINHTILLLAQDAAFLYWLTGEKTYAQFAQPIFQTYINGMYHRQAPIDLDKTHQQDIIGLATFEVIHEKSLIPLALIYDFLHDYLEIANRPQTISVFQKWGNQIIKNGVADNNWNLFQANFLMYVALLLDENSKYDNGQGRQYFLDHIFKTSTDRQLAIQESIRVYDQETGIWPESPAYSLHVTESILHILTLLAHHTGNNELKSYPIIEKSVWASFQYLFPSGYTVGFGDTRHSSIPPATFELMISNYQKHKETDKEKQIAAMLNRSIQQGQYQRKAHDLFDLFFYVDQLPETDAPASIDLLTTPTFYAPNVSLFIQRMTQVKGGLMAATVGSYGNHAHANGIALEFFANGYVMGPDMGKGPSYWHPDHRDYYAQFPAHNTVVVNGKSGHAAMRGQHPFTLDAHYPEANRPKPGFDKISFAQMSFSEPATQADQQRTTILIQTPSGHGYLLDVFRSEVRTEAKQRHDYIYHNIGQRLSMIGMDQQAYTLEPASELGLEAGDLKAYQYLSRKKGLAGNLPLRAEFSLAVDGAPELLMNLWIKGADNQRIFTALSPPSNALSEGTAPRAMLQDSIPTLIVQRRTAAWQNPFTVLYNPTIKDSLNPIRTVEYASESPQARVLMEGEISDIITCLSNSNRIEQQKDFYQKGLLSVIRHKHGDAGAQFIFAADTYQIDYQGWSMHALGSSFTGSLEKSPQGYRLEVDQPILLRIPDPGGEHYPLLFTYRNGEILEKIGATPSRQKPGHLEYRISQAIDFAELNLSTE
ncbi:heparinase II/III domain-containing protein [Dyadobacter tibetensis]|uniref:heparinase II/III domain-containing protein n=1 Tax=Dyadobacter tibetensis TaxID=1211851 RepID=UPI0004B389FE|nr:heparinase II/III family protein [Dyadobacter tibetensis]